MATGAGEVLNNRSDRGSPATMPEAVTPMHGFEAYANAERLEAIALKGPNHRHARVYPRVRSGEYQPFYGTPMYRLHTTLAHRECW